MPASEPLSRQQRHDRIEQVALELFLAKGFDRVTVEDICAVARTAPATFYRHFGSKEAVVFAYRDEFTGALRAALGAVGDLPEAARLAAVLARFAQFLESQQETLALRDRIVLGHPRLMQRTLEVQREIESVLAGGLAGHRGLEVPDPAALLEAGIGIVVLRVSVRRWRTEAGSTLAGVLDETLGDLTDLASRSQETASG